MMNGKVFFPKIVFLISGVLLIIWGLLSGFFISDIEGGSGNKFEVGMHVNLWSLLSFFMGIICLIYYFISKSESE